MKIGKCQCSIFMDNYDAFINGGTDEETKKWMENHKKECVYCRQWAEDYNGNRKSLEDDKPQEVIGSQKKSNTAIALGIVAVIFITFWMSTWIWG